MIEGTARKSARALINYSVFALSLVTYVYMY